LYSVFSIFSLLLAPMEPNKVSANTLKYLSDFVFCSFYCELRRRVIYMSCI